MAYELKASRHVADKLAVIAQANRQQGRELALLLLSLKKNPMPPGSRELRPLGPPLPGAREWRYLRYEIVYQVDTERNREVVSEISVR